MRPADAAPLVGPELPVVLHVPSRHAATELGGGVGDQDGDAVLGHERVGVVGVEGSSARHHGAEAAQVVGVEVSLEHHAQRGGDQAGRGRAVPAHGVDPPLDAEALEQGEGAAVAHALEHAEEPAQVDERRVHDGHAAAQAHGAVAVRLVVLGPDQHPFERLVPEVDALGRAGRAAGEHAHGDAGPRVVRRSALRRAGGDGERLGELGHGGGGGARPLGHQPGQIDRVARHDGEVERGDVVAGARLAAARVDGHDAAPGAQHTEEQPDRSRPVAQEQADLVAGPLHQRARLGDGFGHVAPAPPRALELDRGRARVESQDLGQTCREPARLGGRARPGDVAHRSLGSRRVGGCSATSAMPRGLPSRV